MPAHRIAKPAAAVKALTNAQVIAMVKSGMDDDTVAQAIRAAKAVNFDLTTAGPADSDRRRRQRRGAGGDEGARGADEARRSGENASAGGSTSPK